LRIEDRKHAIKDLLDLRDGKSELTGQSLRAFAVFPGPENGLFHILIINRD
jgi:hypothetical protein